MNVVYFFISHFFMITVANDCECEVEPWSNWGPCSSTCGTSSKKRERICSSCNGWTLCMTCNDEDAKKWNARKTEYFTCHNDPCRKFLNTS